MHIIRASEGNCTPERWDSMVAEDPGGHLLQTWSWADLKRLAGWQAERWYVERDGQVVCGAQVLYQHKGPLQFAYLPKGPFVVHDDSAALGALWRKLHQRCRQRLAISLKIEPEWENGDTAKVDWLQTNGFQVSPITIQPRRTIIVDLQQGESDILARMKSKWRYNISLSERRGVMAHEADADGMQTFYDLMRITAERDHFGIHSLAYYQRAYACFATQRRVQLLIAKYEGEPLAGLMVFAFNGQAWYLYGASSNQHRELMANHLLQWRAMQWAKSQGCHQYDLWGIAGSDNDSADQLKGVGQFKSGFGGRTVQYMGAYDKVYCVPAYRAWERYWRSRKAAFSASGIGG
ncbi:MAG: peptidoglycan bridge formation glycyltransferase FemA/FemB family protein [Chloroflexi bacterium]|nr:peptidoglycan bridge formation glycyltransferase FemA/FemB family protein [Chloroflexota bacterium]